MQLTGPFFLLFFLPLSFAVFLPFRRFRPLIFPFLCLSYPVLCQLKNPFGLLCLLFPATLCFLLIYPDRERCPRLRVALSLLLPLALYFTLRVAAERNVLPFLYPTGLLTVTCHSALAVLDRVQKEESAFSSPFSLLSYLFFFPVLPLGPILFPEQFRAMEETGGITLPRFSSGVLLYMKGFVKRVAVAAVLYRALCQTLLYGEGKLPFVYLPILLLLSGFLCWFLFSGYTDMARGLSSLYGFTLPMEEGIPVTFAFAHSLFRFVRRFLSLLFDRLPPKRATGRLLVGLSLFLSMVIFRPQPSFWLFSLPLLLLLVFFAYYPARGKMHPWLSSLLFLFFLAPAALCGALPASYSPFTLFAGNAGERYRFFYVYSTVSDTRYLFIGCAVFLGYLLLKWLFARLRPHLPASLCRVGTLASTFVLFVFFVLTLLYFMPQFPAYADRPFGTLCF